MLALRFAFGLVACVFLAAPSSGMASSAVHYPFAHALLEEAWSAALPAEPAALARPSRDAELQGAWAPFLPSVALNASHDRNWSQSTLDGRVLGSTQSSQGSGLSIGARQNLFSGFSDVRKLANARRSLAGNDLEQRSARTSLEWRVLDALLVLTAKQATLELKRADVTQARELEGISERKAQSGLLRPKDRLDSRRETVRVAGDALTTEEELALRVRLFNLQFRLGQNAVKVESLPGIARELSAALPAVVPALEENALAEASFKASSGARRLELELQNREAEAAVARVQRFAPSIDLSGSVGLASVDAAAASTLPGSKADLRRSASLSVGASVSLFNPLAWAQAEAQVARLREQESARGLRVESHLRRSVELLAQCRSLARRLREAGELSRITADIRDKNRRLFEAGQLDTLRMIESQQEWSRTQEQEIALSSEFRRQLLALEFFARTGELGETAAPSQKEGVP